MIELSALGSGKVGIDDHGVTREGLLRTQKLAWSDIETYYLTAELVGESRNAISDLDSVVTGISEVLGLADGYLGRHHVQLGIELVGGDTRVSFDWRFDRATPAIAHVLKRIHPALVARQRTQLQETGAVVAGDLRLARDELVWGTREPLARADVEALELFDDTPVCLRAMKRDKAFPYAKANLSEVPGVLGVLAIARELGFPLRGLEIVNVLDQL